MEINQAVEINQCDITMTTYYDITMGNDIGKKRIVQSQWVMILVRIYIMLYNG